MLPWALKTNKQKNPIPVVVFEPEKSREPNSTAGKEVKGVKRSSSRRNIFKTCLYPTPRVIIFLILKLSNFELQPVWKQAAYIAWIKTLEVGRHWTLVQHSLTGNKIEASVTDYMVISFSVLQRPTLILSALYINQYVTPFYSGFNYFY